MKAPTLPEKFKTWNEFYASFRDKLKEDHSLVHFKDISPDNESTYSFTVDEVKARCYDEFIEWYQKNCNPDPYENEWANYYTDKIDNFLHINTENRYT